MIAFLRGQLTEAIPTQVVIDVHGVGYRVLIPLSSFDRLPVPGQEVTLLTHLAVREDAHVLYGFFTQAERDLFRLLIDSVSGIGPKIALNVLSGMNVTAFRAAVAEGDVKALARIHGVGKKTAERIVVELKDKLGQTAVWEAASSRHTLSVADQKLNDAILALMALGYRQAEAHEAVRTAQTGLGADVTVEVLVRTALKQNS
jgi:holliday junction DNA helicase RuvA